VLYYVFILVALLSVKYIVLLFLAASDIVSEFVHVLLHGILFTREIYPQAAFERRKVYSVPVQVTVSLYRSISLCQLHYHVYNL